MRRTKQILDILILVCGGGLVYSIWMMGAQKWGQGALAAAVACMAFAVYDLLRLLHRAATDPYPGKRGSAGGHKLHSLILLDGQEHPVKAWDLRGKTALIIGKAGQDKDLDIDLSDSEYSCFIDFQHAVLNFCMDRWYIEDLESHNGVKVKKVEDGECYRIIHRPCQVVAGDVLYIASTKLLLT